MVAASPNMARLGKLLLDSHLGWQLDRRSVEALIKSPYLRKSLLFHVDFRGEPFGDRMKDLIGHLKPKLVKAFRERFPACRF